MTAWIAPCLLALRVPQQPGDDTGMDARLLFAIAAFGLATLMIVYVRRRRTGARSDR